MNDASRGNEGHDSASTTGEGRGGRVDTSGRRDYNRDVRRHTFLNDIIFKIVFGARDSEGLLRALINALLGLSGPERITEVEILNPFVEKRYAEAKGGVLDVKAKDSQGRMFNVELQVCNQRDYAARVLYYLDRLFTEQIKEGDPYSRLGRTIGISLLDFVIFPDRDDLHSMYCLYDPVHAHRLTDLQELHFIELRKYRDDKPKALMTPFEKWLHVLKFGDIYECGQEPLPRELVTEEGIEMAIDRLHRAWANDELRDWIDYQSKARSDYASGMESSYQAGLEEGEAAGLEKGLAQGEAAGLEKGLAQGEAAGLEKGLAQGEAAGLEKGLAQGEAAGLEKAARRMLEAGMDRETVCRTLGIDPSILP